MSIAPLSAVDRRQAEVLGVKVDLATMDETVARLDGLLQSEGAHIVATADASGIYMAQKDPELAEIYAQASHVTADSYGVVWALRRKGIHTPRVSGVDVADRLMALGAAPGVPEAAAERLRLIHPGCNIVGTRHGYFPASDDQLVAEEVAKAQPDILLVAMGIPRQEKFIRATLGVIQAKVSVGVGGSFDVWSGRAKRAPLIIQKMKLEWAWRLLLNPKKISKAKTLPRFAWRVLKSGR